MVGANLSVMAFDLDDTLTVSKSKIEPRMARLLDQLLAQLDVCIISGGRFEQFDSQVLRFLADDPASLRRLHIMPTCGTRYYTWSGDWIMQYSEDLTDSEKASVIEVLTAGAKQLGLWEASPWGDIIEDRGSQITYSALGQQAPVEPKYEWDRDGLKKQRLRDYAAARLPSLEVRVGGSTSVDVTRKGIDKAYGISKLINKLGITSQNMLFVGDRLFQGGNDYPVKALGVPCVEVTRWEDTADFVESYLNGA
jgi:HAD superfamily hydrolase (TIGR01484 family)